MNGRIRQAASTQSLTLGLACLVSALNCAAQDVPLWTLSPDQLRALEQRQVLVEAVLAGSGPDAERGSVRAAVIIDAQPELVFRIMISCTEALKFVPHLRSCLVVDAAPDGGWQVIEQEVDYSWLLPRMRYAFKARYEAGRRVQFSNVSGDFREHEGIWHLQPMDDGNRTLLTYAVKAVPRFFVPQWLIRRSLRKELPELLRRLRTQCESVRSAPPALERPEP